MSPLAHFIGSWLVAVATTDNPRDRKLVTFAGVLPDADGFGVVVDVVGSVISGKENTFHYYQQYHHILLHGWPGALVVSLLLMCFTQKSRACCSGVWSLSICTCSVIWSDRAAQPLATSGRSAIPSRFFATPSGFGKTNGSSMVGRTNSSLSRSLLPHFGWPRRKDFHSWKFSAAGWIRFLCKHYKNGGPIFLPETVRARRIARPIFVQGRRIKSGRRIGCDG